MRADRKMFERHPDSPKFLVGVAIVLLIWRMATMYNAAYGPAEIKPKSGDSEEFVQEVYDAFSAQPVSSGEGGEVSVREQLTSLLGEDFYACEDAAVLPDEMRKLEWLDDALEMDDISQECYEKAESDMALWRLALIACYEPCRISAEITDRKVLGRSGDQESIYHEVRLTFWDVEDESRQLYSLDTWCTLTKERGNGKWIVTHILMGDILEP